MITDKEFREIIKEMRDNYISLKEKFEKLNHMNNMHDCALSLLIKIHRIKVDTNIDVPTMLTSDNEPYILCGFETSNSNCDEWTDEHMNHLKERT